MQDWVKTLPIVSLPQQALLYCTFHLFSTEMFYCFGVNASKALVCGQLRCKIYFLPSSFLLNKVGNHGHALTKPQLHRISITKNISYVAKWFSLFLKKLTFIFPALIETLLRSLQQEMKRELQKKHPKLCLSTLPQLYCGPRWCYQSVQKNRY